MPLLLDFIKPIEGGHVTYSGRVIGKHGRELQPTVTTKGYLSVGCSRSGGRTHSIRVHQLVALAFVPNDMPLFYRQVDHRDGDKSNNAASNLRWVDNSINNREKFALRRRRGLPLHTPRELAAIERRRKARQIDASAESTQSSKGRPSCAPGNQGGSHTGYTIKTPGGAFSLLYAPPCQGTGARPEGGESPRREVN